jgi:hypothetical protein
VVVVGAVVVGKSRVGAVIEVGEPITAAPVVEVVEPARLGLELDDRLVLVVSGSSVVREKVAGTAAGASGEVASVPLGWVTTSPRTVGSVLSPGPDVPRSSPPWDPKLSTPTVRSATPAATESAPTRRCRSLSDARWVAMGR